MTESELMDLTVLERKKYNYLNEVMDLSRQMGEALDRNDQVSVRMLLAMRGEPVQMLEEVDRTAKSRRSGLTEDDRRRLRALLNGAPPRSSQESLYVENAGKTRRLLERTVELDKALSLRMARSDSFYQK